MVQRKKIRDKFETAWPDTPGWMPSVERADNPLLGPAPTVADQYAAVADAPITQIRRAVTTPHETEFSWGLGNMAPIARGHEPTPFEEMKAVQRTNPADPGSAASYDEWIRE